MSSEDYVDEHGSLDLGKAAAYRDPNAVDITGKFDQIELKPVWVAKKDFNMNEFLEYDRYYTNDKPEEKEKWEDVWYVYIPVSKEDGWLCSTHRLGQLHKEGDKWRVVCNEFSYYFWDTGPVFDTQEEALRALLVEHSAGAPVK